MEYKKKNSDALVDMVDIHKYFGSVQALRGVDFHVERNEIVGLLGDNGAGKSTLIKVLTGFHTPTRGQIYFDGEVVDIDSPHRARELGIETVYQDLALVPLMSIARNFWLGQEPTYNVGPFKFIDKEKMGVEAIAALRDVGIHIRDPEETVGTMSGGERQSIAIGRAVYFGQKLLILDEPTSALSVGETQVLDVRTLLTDDQTWTSGVNGHQAFLVRALNDDPRNTGLTELRFDMLLDLQVFVKKTTEVFAVSIPTAIRSAVDAEAQANRINFLTHYAASASCDVSRRTMVICENGFMMRAARPRARARIRFMTRFLPTCASTTTRLSMSRS